MQSRATSGQVGRDVQNVVSEAQDLLKTVKEEGASRLDDVKSKVASQYDTAREKFGEIQTTVQDLGRPGYGAEGVSPSGAADPISLHIGNLLVSNPANASGLEMTLMGGAYTFPEGAIAAITGFFGR